MFLSFWHFNFGIFQSWQWTNWLIIQPWQVSRDECKQCGWFRKYFHTWATVINQPVRNLQNYIVEAFVNIKLFSWWIESKIFNQFASHALIYYYTKFRQKLTSINNIERVVKLFLNFNLLDWQYTNLLIGKFN